MGAHPTIATSIKKSAVIAGRKSCFDGPHFPQIDRYKSAPRNAFKYRAIACKAHRCSPG